MARRQMQDEVMDLTSVRPRRGWCKRSVNSKRSARADFRSQSSSLWQWRLYDSKELRYLASQRAWSALQNN